MTMPADTCRTISLAGSPSAIRKALSNFNLKRLPPKVALLAKSLLEGEVLDRRENVLTFGNPGSGKTHLLYAVGQELIARGRRMYFTTSARLVQDLLVAKRDLKLSRFIKKLAHFEGLIIDDLGYVQQSRDEIEVLFTLLAERYERGSVFISNNVPFSKWEGIFKDPMTTATAIDRLVHHCVILELNIPSYRVEQAKKTKQDSTVDLVGSRSRATEPPSVPLLRRCLDSGQDVLVCRAESLRQPRPYRVSHRSKNRWRQSNLSEAMMLQHTS